MSNFTEVKKSFLASVVETVSVEEIRPELILNWDQTGVMIIPSTSWTMDERDTIVRSRSPCGWPGLYEAI